MIKKILFSAIVAFLAVSTTFAQAKKDHQHRNDDKRLERLTKELNLSSEQAAEITKINKEAAQNKQQLAKASKQERQMRVQEINEKYKAVLSAEQYAKFQELQAKKKAKAKDRPRGKDKGNKTPKEDKQ